MFSGAESAVKSSPGRAAYLVVRGGTRSRSGGGGGVQWRQFNSQLLGEGKKWICYAAIAENFVSKLQSSSDVSLVDH